MRLQIRHFPFCNAQASEKNRSSPLQKRKKSSIRLSTCQDKKSHLRCRCALRDVSAHSAVWVGLRTGGVVPMGFHLNLRFLAALAFQTSCSDVMSQTEVAVSWLVSVTNSVRCSYVLFELTYCRTIQRVASPRARRSPQARKYRRAAPDQSL